ncbi:MAG: acyl-CoA thioesterase [Hyphomicrobiales bacterium]
MFRTVITPRVSETDGVGHINNTAIPVWFEAGRIGIFRLMTPDLSFRGWRATIVSMQVDYVAQTYFGKDCVVETWIERIGNTSFTIGERLLQDDVVCATGRAVYVNFDHSRQKSEAIAGALRAGLEAHLLPQGPAA